MIYKIRDDVPGYMNWQQIHLILRQVIQLNGPANILELGSFFGKLTVQLDLNVNPGVNIHTIDKWGGINQEVFNFLYKITAQKTEVSALESLDNIKSSMVDGKMSAESFYDWWKYFTKDTTNVTHYKDYTNLIDETPFPMFDIVIQDAAHDYDGVIAECHKWWPKLKTGGFWIADDYTPTTWPACKQALDDFFDQQQVQKIVKDPEQGYLYLIK